MRPGQRFVGTLSASPLAPGVTAHSIIAVRGRAPSPPATTGWWHTRARTWTSVASEKVVHSSHSTQSEPETIQEVRRILREHVAGTAEKPGTPVAHSAGWTCTCSTAPTGRG